MQYYLAPLESITGVIYRNTHEQFFGGATRYYMPFISPTKDHIFTPRQLRQISPQYNEGVCAIPQVLVRNTDDFIWSAKALADMGHTQVNLNLGCPSATVTTKGKGSGFLSFPQELDAFFDKAFEALATVPIDISVKTRLGKEDPEEFYPLLDIYQKYPISELTIHPRVQKDGYKNNVRMDVFCNALEQSKIPVCYNGDVVTQQDYETLLQQAPTLNSIMIGRGVLADPALLRKLQGGKGTDRATLQTFTKTLFERYATQYQSEKTALMRMREVWYYQIHLFDENEKLMHKLRRMKSVQEYQLLEQKVFDTLPLRTDARARWKV